MAEIITKNRNRSSRQPIRVDLTAMVDLGFLLITFFMLATTMTKNKSMLVDKMDDTPTEHPPVVPASKTMRLLLGDNDKVYYYTASDDINNINDIKIDSTDYSPQGLRRAIQNRQEEVMEKYGKLKKDELFVMIKPLPKSKLQNTIDTFDELTINGVKRYAIVEPDDKVDSLVANMVGQRLH
jgi:biopolymer transport protein ExbD